MKLLVRHQTIYRYDASAGRVAMRLKLMPVDTPAQTVLDWQVSVNDVPLTAFHANSYGEREAIWVRQDGLDHATIVAQGLVETRETHGVVGGPASRVHALHYLRNTPLTQASDGIAAMARALPDGDGPLARLHALSAAVTSAVSYRAGVTTSATTAAQAFALGAGVCQDHAQIFIAGARSLGIPARYVTGYLLSGDGSALHETHGWAEALVPELGWIGFDPSNAVCVTERYLRVASGLDADDAAPIRGTITVAGAISIDADVQIAQAQDGVEERQLQRQQQQATPPTTPRITPRG